MKEPVIVALLQFNWIILSYAKTQDYYNKL